MPSSTRALPTLPSSQLLQRLSLRQLRAFVAVAQAGSMTQAAVLMHLTPSALSMLIKSLEEELEIRLFDRNSRKLALTEPASTLLPVVQSLLLGLKHCVEQLRNQSQQAAQRFTVVTSPLMAASLLPDLMASFRKTCPDVQIRLIDAAVDTLGAYVRSGQADVGICTLDQDFSDLKIIPLMEDSLMLACHPTHPLATQTSQGSVQWRQLLGERLILLSKGSGLRQLVEQTLNKQPIKARRQSVSATAFLSAQHSHEVSHVATAVGLVRAGEGVSVLPAYALARALAEQRRSLCVLTLINPVVKRKVVAISVRRRPLPEAAQLFLQHVKHQLSA